MTRLLARPISCLFTAFSSDTGGNISIIFAAVLMPVMVFIGSAVDYGRASTTRSAMADALDSAALAGARTYVTTYGDVAASEEAAKTFFRNNYVGSQGTLNDGDDGNDGSLPGANSGVRFSVSVDEEKRIVTATATARIPTSFLGLIGMETLKVSDTVTSAFSQMRPVSVGLVLDVSGSMKEFIPGAANRMAALKSAARSLLDILDDANPTGGNVRTGLTTFSTSLVNRVAFADGSAHVRRRIERLRPLDMTQMNAALAPMKTMIGPETRAFGGAEPLRFVILMTDGYSTVHPRRDVRDTLKTCSALKADGVEVFTVNLNGDAGTLKTCASDARHFFDTSNHAQFKKAFEAIATDILARSIRLAS